jgi:hypothetical protein
LGSGSENNVKDPMSGDSIAVAGAVPQQYGSGHGPVMLAGFADAERIEALGAIIHQAPRGAELRAEAHR